MDAKNFALAAEQANQIADDFEQGNLQQAKGGIEKWINTFLGDEEQHEELTNALVRVAEVYYAIQGTGNPRFGDYLFDGQLDILIRLSTNHIATLMNQGFRERAKTHLKSLCDEEFQDAYHQVNCGEAIKVLRQITVDIDALECLPVIDSMFYGADLVGQDYGPGLNGNTTLSNTSGNTVHLKSNGDCLIAERIQATGIFEPTTMEIWTALVKQMDRVLDIGANSGVYALMAAAESSNVSVQALEPHPERYQRLTENIALNGFSRVTAHHAIAATVPGSESYSYTSHSDGGRWSNGFGSAFTGTGATSVEVGNMVVTSDLNAGPRDRLLVRANGPDISAMVLTDMSIWGEREGACHFVFRQLDEAQCKALNGAFGGGEYRFFFIDEARHRITELDTLEPMRPSDRQNYNRLITTLTPEDLKERLPRHVCVQAFQAS